MLHDFIVANRDALIARSSAKVTKRRDLPLPSEPVLTSGVPVFLDQLAEALRFPARSMIDAIEKSAAEHGATLHALGYTVSHVVHDYGDICQAITELADELHASISTEQFRTLNRCLDCAIAEAVTEYARLRDLSMTEGATERSAVVAHGLRSRVSAAELAFKAIKDGGAPTGGSLQAVVTRNLRSMTALLDAAGRGAPLASDGPIHERVHLYALMEDAEVEGMLEARARGISLSVAPTDRAINVDVDPRAIAAAVADLLQNAFDFTPRGGSVSLGTSLTAGRVAIAVEDECGGLPPGKTAEISGAFQRRGTDRGGLGLGLFLSRNGVDASGGVIRVRDLPGTGCVFTIDLPLGAP